MTIPGEDREYLDWLTRKVTRSNRYSLLLSKLYSTEFVAKNPRDENRIDDAVELREEFIDYYGFEPDIDIDCSILELLIGICYRIVEIMGEDEELGVEKWFWILVDNVLDDYKIFDNRNLTKNRVLNEELNAILYRFVNRKYDFDGSNGGIFPLKRPEMDQKRVEIWYQMQSYLNERFPD